MAFHCLFFTVGHIIAIISFYSMWMHSIFMFFFLGVMVWNGSSYYVKYFSRSQKIEKNEERIRAACVEPSVNKKAD